MVIPKKRHHNENVTLKNSRRIATDEEPVIPHGSSDTTTTTTTDLAAPESTQLLQPITEDGTRPQKRFYRQRAHCNPLAHNDSYDYPISPVDMDWNRTSNLYPAAAAASLHGAVSDQGRSTTLQRHAAQQQPTVLDIGCGFGGLTLALASILPHRNILGIEIRAKVTEYVRLRILAARKEKSYGINPHAIEHSIPPPPPSSSSCTITTAHTTISLPAIPMSSVASAEEASAVVSQPQPQLQQQQQHHYNNCGVIRTNSMKYGPNYFAPHSISKLFFCFPDPHFKRKNFPRRIVSYRLLDEYAYLLQTKRANVEQRSDHDENAAGLLYAITDVKELHEWHVQVCQAHPLFESVLMSESSSSSGGENKNNVEEDRDPCIYAMKYLTEEGQKVDRNGGTKYYIIYVCHYRPKEEAPLLHAGNFFRS